MALLSEWIKNLIFLTVFATVLELLLPNNDMKKFVRLLIGLFLVAAILRPVGSILSADLSAAALFTQGKSSQPVMGQAELAKAEEQRQAVLGRVYCRELEAKIKETLASVPRLAVQKIEVVLDTVQLAAASKTPAEAASLIKAVYVMAKVGENDRKIRVTLASDGAVQMLSDEMQDKVRRQLYTVYQLPAEKIIFRCVEVE